MKNVIRKLLVGLLAMLGAVMVYTSAMTMPVSASAVQNVRMGDILDNSFIGADVAVNNNYIFENVLIKYSLGNKNIMSASKAKTCAHTCQTRYGQGHFQKVLVGTKGTCYKTRCWYYAKCTKCKKTGLKSYDSWTYHKKHHYKVFGKQCTECGYKK